MAAPAANQKPRLSIDPPRGRNIQLAEGQKHEHAGAWDSAVAVYQKAARISDSPAAAQRLNQAHAKWYTARGDAKAKAEGECECAKEDCPHKKAECDCPKGEGEGECGCGKEDCSCKKGECDCPHKKGEGECSCAKEDCSCKKGEGE